MVKKIISFLGKEISGLHDAAYLLGAFALMSQVLALVRDRLLAHAFGAGQTLDLYYAAFRVPDFIFAIVASLFSASIIIPFLSERLQVNKEAGREFLSVVFTIFLLTMIGVSALVFFLMPHFVSDIFPGFSSEPYRSQIILLTRILLISPIMLGLSNLIASVTQLYNRFFIYGISPLLYNVGIIFGVLVLAPRFGPAGLVWGVAFGAILHFLVQVPFVARQGLFPKLVLSFKKFRTTFSMFLVAFPRTLAISAQEVSEFFLISLASLMSAGSISVLSLAWNLQSVPLSVVGVSYSLAAFPTMAVLFASGERKKFLDLIDTTSRYIIFFSLPLISLFVVLRAHIVRVILGSGEFTWQDTRLTAAALALFVISLAAQSLILVFTRARYASGNTRTPFYINMFSTIIIIGCAAFLSRFAMVFPQFQYFIESLFRVTGVPGTTVLMLPLSFTIGSIIAALIHIFMFEKDYGGVMKSLGRTLGQLLFVALVMGFATYISLNLLQGIFSLDTFIGVLSQGFIAGIVGIICGIILLALLGSRELKETMSALHRKFWKTPVIGPDPEV